jgi:hypothetical protein
MSSRNCPRSVIEKLKSTTQYWFSRFLVVGNIFRLETCMNSLVKIPPYSKLNFQGKIFFTQNWCNITNLASVSAIFLLGFGTVSTKFLFFTLIPLELKNYFPDMCVFKVILHQFWVKKIFPWKFNLEYGMYPSWSLGWNIWFVFFLSNITFTLLP